VTRPANEIVDHSALPRRRLESDRRDDRRSPPRTVSYVSGAMIHGDGGQVAP